MSGYLPSVGEGLEFIIAFGSLLGILALAVGLMILLLGGGRARSTAVKAVVIGFVLVCVCGFERGLYFFQII